MSSSLRSRRALPRLIALVMLTGLLVVAARRLSWQRVLAELAQARPWWIVLALLCFVAILPLWAAQWRILAPKPLRPAFSTMLGVIAMTSTVLNTTPLLVGEAAGVFFLVTEAGLPRATALSVLAMDQLFVGVAKLGVLAGAALTLTLPRWIEGAALALVAAVGALVLALLVVAWRAQRLSVLMTRALPARASNLLVSFGAALEPLRSPRRSARALSLALAKKLVELLAILCIQHAFGVTVPPQSALLVLATVNLATLLPLVPGNVGVYEAAVVLAYTWLGITPERAVGIALVQHACFVAALALPGYRWLGRVAPRSSAATL